MRPAEFIEGIWPDNQLERIDLPSKRETKVSIPDWVRQSPVMSWVQHEISGDEVWSHQGLALDAAYLKGDIALTTGTNSGKSLIPQILFLHRLMTEKNSTFMVVPPLTALNRDQLRRWEAAFQFLKLPSEWFAKIDGTVPAEERLAAMKNARLLFITPHSLHGWFLDNLKDLGVQRVLRYMRAGFLDEVHSYEEVMGSNAALLYRRFMALHELINPGHDIQWIAASGTLGQPKTFLKKLLSRDFTVIGHDKDGSKQNRRSVFHLQAEGHREKLEAGKDIAKRAVEQGLPGLIFYFIDSREAVELVTEDLQRQIGHDLVIGYSGRYSRSDVIPDIDRRMRDGSAKIVVTTSALQAGVHLPNANLVINADIPLWINDFHQRLGRSGRGDEEAAMVLIGDRAKFRHFEIGEEKGLAAYVHTPPETPLLYLENRALAFIHAQCLAVERNRLGIEKLVSAKAKPVQVTAGTAKPVAQPIRWPAGFNEAVKMAKSNRRDIPPELRPLKLPRTHSPNRDFPLLNMGNRRCYLILEKRGQSRDKFPKYLTDMSVEQAVRECPPGGTFWQNGRPYFVVGWNYAKSMFAPPAWHIKVAPSDSKSHTVGIASEQIQGDLHRGGVIQGNFICHAEGPENGFIAEMNLRVVTKITDLLGTFLTPDGQYRRFKVHYRDVSEEAKGNGAPVEEAQSDQKVVKESKFFAQKLYKFTTGVVVYMPERWFGEDARRVIAEELVRSYLNARGKSAADFTRSPTVGFDTTNIIINQNQEGAMKGHALAVFDNVQCSLRLTEYIFKNFNELLEDALRDDSERLDEKKRAHLHRAMEWYKTLQPQPLPTPQEFMHGNQFAQAPAGYALAFSVGSLVDRERDGVRTAFKVAGYTLLDDPITHEKAFAYKLQAPYVPNAKWATASFDAAGNLAVSRKEQDVPIDNGFMIVPEEEVQAPLDHVRFSYDWVNLTTFQTRKPDIAPITAPVSGAVVDAKI